MPRFKLLDRIRGSVLAGSVGTSASEDKLLSSRESHPGLSRLIPGSRLLIEGTRFSTDRHQGKDNLLLFPREEIGRTGPVRCRDRLRGLLKFYHRAAA